MFRTPRPCTRKIKVTQSRLSVAVWYCQSRYGLDGFDAPLEHLFLAGPRWLTSFSSPSACWRTCASDSFQAPFLCESPWLNKSHTVANTWASLTTTFFRFMTVASGSVTRRVSASAPARADQIKIHCGIVIRLSFGTRTYTLLPISVRHIEITHARHHCDESLQLRTSAKKMW